MSDDLDFDAALRRAGVTVPAERDAIMRDAYRQMQVLLKVLDDPLAYEDEPAQLPRYDRGLSR
ncbi:MAG TPA: hypothetical protein VGG57_21340 [Stellaceae bacterium]|jgi:hypothetical protein